MVSCPNCGGTELEQQDATGDTICMNCGTVLEESNIVSAVEFQETAGGASSVIGQYISATATRPYTGSGPGYGISRESREVAIENGRRLIANLAGRLHLNTHFVDSAHRLYILAIENRFTSGRKSSHVVAACLYIVCRREKSPHLLIDFADALSTSVYALGTTYIRFCRLLKLNLPVIDPSLFIHRFAARMELGDATHQVSLTAMRLIQRMKRDWIETGRRPAGICGACLLIAARVHGFRRSIAEIQAIVKVTDVTLRNRLVEFENTPASLLTYEEFQQLDMGDGSSGEGGVGDTLEAADPPAYIRGLLEEEIAKEAALLEDAYAADTDGVVGIAAGTPFTAAVVLGAAASSKAASSSSSSSSSSAAAMMDSSVDNSAALVPYQQPSSSSSSSSAAAGGGGGDDSLSVARSLLAENPPLMRPSLSAGTGDAALRARVTAATVDRIFTANPDLSAALASSFLITERDVDVHLRTTRAEGRTADGLRRGRRKNKSAAAAAAGAAGSSSSSGGAEDAEDDLGFAAADGGGDEEDEDEEAAGFASFGDELGDSASVAMGASSSSSSSAAAVWPPPASAVRSEAEENAAIEQQAAVGTQGTIGAGKPGAIGILGTAPALAVAAAAARVPPAELIAAAAEVGLTPLTADQLRLMKARALLRSNWAAGKRDFQRAMEAREALLIKAIAIARGRMAASRLTGVGGSAVLPIDDGMSEMDGQSDASSALYRLDAAIAAAVGGGGDDQDDAQRMGLPTASSPANVSPSAGGAFSSSSSAGAGSGSSPAAAASASSSSAAGGVGAGMGSEEGEQGFESIDFNVFDSSGPQQKKSKSKKGGKGSAAESAEPASSSSSSSSSSSAAAPAPAPAAAGGRVTRRRYAAEVSESSAAAAPPMSPRRAAAEGLIDISSPGPSLLLPPSAAAVPPAADGGEEYDDGPIDEDVTGGAAAGGGVDAEDEDAGFTRGRRGRGRGRGGAAGRGKGRKGAAANAQAEEEEEPAEEALGRGARKRKPKGGGDSPSPSPTTTSASSPSGRRHPVGSFASYGAPPGGDTALSLGLHGLDASSSSSGAGAGSSSSALVPYQGIGIGPLSFHSGAAAAAGGGGGGGGSGDDRSIVSVSQRGPGSFIGGSGPPRPQEELLTGLGGLDRRQLRAKDAMYRDLAYSMAAQLTGADKGKSNAAASAAASSGAAAGAGAGSGQQQYDDNEMDDGHQQQPPLSEAQQSNVSAVTSRLLYERVKVERPVAGPVRLVHTNITGDDLVKAANLDFEYKPRESASAPPQATWVPSATLTAAIAGGIQQDDEGPEGSGAAGDDGEADGFASIDVDSSSSEHQQMQQEAGDGEPAAAAAAESQAPSSSEPAHMTAGGAEGEDQQQQEFGFVSAEEGGGDASAAGGGEGEGFEGDQQGLASADGAGDEGDDGEGFAEAAGPSDNLSDISDDDVGDYLLPPEEAVKREAIWQEIHGDFLQQRAKQQQEAKAKALGGGAGAGEEPLSKAAIAKKKYTQKVIAGATAEESALHLVKKASKTSKRINKAAMEQLATGVLFKKDGTGAGSGSSSSSRAAEDGEDGGGEGDAAMGFASVNEDGQDSGFASSGDDGGDVSAKGSSKSKAKKQQKAAGKSSKAAAASDGGGDGQEEAEGFASLDADTAAAAMKEGAAKRKAEGKKRTRTASAESEPAGAGAAADPASSKPKKKVRITEPASSSSSSSSSSVAAEADSAPAAAAAAVAAAASSKKGGAKPAAVKIGRPVAVNAASSSTAAAWDGGEGGAGDGSDEFVYTSGYGGASAGDNVDDYAYGGGGDDE